MNTHSTCFSRFSSTLLTFPSQAHLEYIYTNILFPSSHPVFDKINFRSSIIPSQWCYTWSLRHYATAKCYYWPRVMDVSGGGDGGFPYYMIIIIRKSYRVVKG
jgi:hypothetical protein